MKQNAKQKLKQSWEKLQETTGKITDKMAGPAKEKADKYMGIWVHKQIATLFIWDEHVQAWVFGGWVCPNCVGGIDRGQYNRDKFDECKNCGSERPDDPKKVKGIVELAGSQEAVNESEQLKAYIVTKSNQDRKYQKKMNELAEKLKGKDTFIMEKYEQMKDSKFVEWIKDETGTSEN